MIDPIHSYYSICYNEETSNIENNFMPNKKTLVVYFTHISDEPLSDGNTGKKIDGRLQLLSLSLRTLQHFNKKFPIPIIILDTGDMEEWRVLKVLEPLGFKKIIVSDHPGFDIPDFPDANRKLFIRYNRSDGFDKSQKLMRHLKSFETAMIYGRDNDFGCVLTMEGDALLFGNEFISIIAENLAEHTMANCSLNNMVYLDFWAANPVKILPEFKKIYSCLKNNPRDILEMIFANIIKDRKNIGNIMVGEKSLDQNIESQKNDLGLKSDYFKYLPYSWITHPTEKQIKILVKYIDELTGRTKTTKQLLKIWLSKFSSFK